MPKRLRYVSDHLATALRKLLADPADREQAESALRYYDANHKSQEAFRNLLKGGNHNGVQEITVDGKRFESITQAFNIARAEGYDGSRAAFVSRLTKLSKWAQIIAPVDRKKHTPRKTREQKAEALQRELRGEST